MKPGKSLVLAATLLLANATQGALVAHYTFDSDYSATVGTAATAGSRATISTTTSAVGAGSMALGTSGTDTSGNDGAVSGNSFDWAASDIRSVAFWMKAQGTQDSNPTMLSLGSGSGTGNRFDVRLTGSSLRLELQGGGFTTSANVGDGNWYHVTLVVPNSASTLANVLYYVHDTTATLAFSGTMTGATAVATGVGPLRMGDSYQDTGRDFFGFMDDVRLYDNAISQTDARGLAALWSPVPEPAVTLLGSLGVLGLLRRRRA